MNANEMKKSMYLKIMNWIDDERHLLMQMCSAPSNNEMYKLSILSKVSELGSVQAAITCIFLEESDG